MGKTKKKKDPGASIGFAEAECDAIIDGFLDSLSMPSDPTQLTQPSPAIFDLPDVATSSDEKPARTSHTFDVFACEDEKLAEGTEPPGSLPASAEVFDMASGDFDASVDLTSGGSDASVPVPPPLDKKVQDDHDTRLPHPPANHADIGASVVAAERAALPGQVGSGSQNLQTQCGPSTRAWCDYDPFDSDPGESYWLGSTDEAPDASGGGLDPSLIAASSRGTGSLGTSPRGSVGIASDDAQTLAVGSLDPSAQEDVFDFFPNGGNIFDSSPIAETLDGGSDAGLSPGGEFSGTRGFSDTSDGLHVSPFAPSAVNTFLGHPRFHEFAKLMLPDVYASSGEECEHSDKDSDAADSLCDHSDSQASTSPRAQRDCSGEHPVAGAHTLASSGDGHASADVNAGQRGATVAVAHTLASRGEGHASTDVNAVRHGAHTLASSGDGHASADVNAGQHGATVAVAHTLASCGEGHASTDVNAVRHGATSAEAHTLASGGEGHASSDVNAGRLGATHLSLVKSQHLVTSASSAASVHHGLAFATQCEPLNLLPLKDSLAQLLATSLAPSPSIEARLAGLEVYAAATQEVLGNYTPVGAGSSDQNSRTQCGHMPLDGKQFGDSHKTQCGPPPLGHRASAAAASTLGSTSPQLANERSTRGTMSNLGASLADVPRGSMSNLGASLAQQTQCGPPPLGHRASAAATSTLGPSSRQLANERSSRTGSKPRLIHKRGRRHT